MSGFLIVPYVLGFAAAFLNPVRLLAGLYDAADFAAGVPSWQPATAFLLLAAGLAQAAGLVLAAAEAGGRPRARLGRKTRPPRRDVRPRGRL
ncbi:hypothetical protein EDD27_1797 [Nonomuraea polychroma]|uniref:Uncharacterized protein n=1 Tax=Nonomuraea polychroma TaxID=46176 RepID=A0A438M0W3_9ACTN|nr:hypothetical protein [Nonomuraea polychroma]RVX39440.1 hypothetical protein EDD27_1797 [Nonomuraea polychroma]